MLSTKIFGCKVNKYFTELWGKKLSTISNPIKKQKKSINKKDPSTVQNYLLIASCVVTDKAKKKRVKAVLDAIKQKNHIYLTGCGVFDRGKAQDPTSFYKLYPSLSPYQERITILGESPSIEGSKNSIDSMITSPNSVNSQQVKRPNKGNNQTSEITKQVNGSNTTTRKFLVIQSGCDSFCTFCLTIRKRGAHWSRPLADIIADIRAYEEQGGKEIVLTGINLGARGATSTNDPASSQFPLLLETILRRTNIPRIRISSLGPEFISNDVLDLWTDTRILPYFHLSIQSFSDPILQDMQRHYDAAHLHNCLAKIHKLERPDRDIINIGADIIVGFPGETLQDFATTHQSIRQYRISQLHAFPFSAHEVAEHVPAGTFDKQISQTIKSYRMHLLNEAGQEAKKALRKATIGHEVTILFEGKTRIVHDEQGIMMNENTKQHPLYARYGWTNNYIPVAIKGLYEKNQLVTKKLEQEDIAPRTGSDEEQ